MKKLSELLDLEHEVELEESQQILSQFNVKQLENRGICIRKLCITGQRCGFYGRTVYKLENSKHLSTLSTQNSANNNKKVFSSIFSVGNIVSIFTSTTPTENSGVVTHINPLSITVAFDQPPFTDQSFDETNVSLVKMNSDVTYKRLKRALDCLLDNKHGPAKHIISVCFENALLLPVNPKYLISNTVAMNKYKPGDEFEIKIYNPQLNAIQRQTVLDVLSRQDISIIHGPPGTGKTTTVVECIIQCVRRSYKVLACAPSNIAVDNLLTKLAPRCRVVRLGHPARAVFELQKYSLDAQVTSSDSFDIIKQVRGEIEKAIGIGSKKKHKVNWSEVRELKKELHERENKVVYEILNAADIVLSTTTSASFDGPLKVLRKEHFNVVFIDECAQVIEPGCWIPLLHAGKCVLAGDHLQLPPTIISEEAAKGGLNVTLMERLVSMHGTVAVSLLTTQYRMNSHIMHWPSQFLYGGMLIADDSVSQRLLSGLKNVECNVYTDTPLLFIDTAGCEYEESAVPEEVSKSNEGEAGLVFVYVNMLIKFGLSPSEIAVIAPYSLQVELITTKLAAVGIDSVEVHTVDGFQGREKEVVIISFTRSNDRGEIGFLSEVRRTNVAITRAKRHLCVIGDSVTISNQGFIKGLLDYIQRFGEVRSGFDLLHEDVGIVNESADSGTVKSAEVKSNLVREGEVSFLESKEKERCLDEKIRKFTDNDNLETFEFASLTSRERYLVHKLCEEIGLCHTSKGDGKERNILISKCVNEEILPVIDLNLEENHTSLIDSSADLFPKRDCGTQVRNDRILFETTTRHDSLILCEICRKDIPRMNIVTHQAHCLRYTELNNKLDSAIITAKKATSHKRKSKKPGKCTVNKLHVDSNIKDAKKQLDLQDDFAVLEAAIKMKEVCNFNKCNESIKLIGEYCLYCKLHFCIKHCQYEVHGCTNMARSDNRISFMESSRTIPKKQRVELEKKYQSKLDEKAKSRKGQK